VFYRYAGLSAENESPEVVRALVPPAMVERARLLGAAFRVGHLISAAQPGVLPATHFRTRNHKLTLVLDDRIADLAADRVTNRFKQLTRLIGQGRAVKKR
jgi:exopolyphosphatase/guanosine-5'-triphosphate,3'-diphosphate pyrophosphatase